MVVLRLSILSLLIMFSIFSQVHSQGKPKDIIIENNPEMVDVGISEIASSIKYIPLETVKGSYLNSISQMLFIDEDIVILDKSRELIVIFSSEGKYIKSIKTVGKGPQEYIRINNIYCYKGQLTLYDRSLKKIIVYDKEYNFLEAFELKNQIIRLHHASNSFIGYNHPPNNWATDSYRVIVFDETMNEISRLHKMEIGSISEDPVSVNSYVLDDTLVVWNSNSTMVYQYKGKNESVRFRINYDKKIHPEILNSVVMNGSDNSNLILIDFIETKDMLFLDLVKNRRMVMAVYDFLTKSMIYLDSNRMIAGFTDDLYDVCRIWPIGKISDKIVWDQVSNTDLSNILKYNKDYVPSQKFSELKKTTDLSSNPILIIVNLK